MGRYEKVTVVDLEATCWENNYDKNLQYDQEIIEIGVVSLNQYERKVERYDSYLVKPIYSDKLSPFCKDLTGITQEEVDQGGTLAEALDDIYKNYSTRVMASWGSWDVKRLRWDCENKGVYNPFNRSTCKTRINVAQLLCMMKGFKNRKGLKKGMYHTGVVWEDVMNKYDLEGMEQHRALPDALVATEILLQLIKGE